MIKQCTYQFPASRDDDGNLIEFELLMYHRFADVSITEQPSATRQYYFVYTSCELLMIVALYLYLSHYAEHTNVLKACADADDDDDDV